MLNKFNRIATDSPVLMAAIIWFAVAAFLYGVLGAMLLSRIV